MGSCPDGVERVARPNIDKAGCFTYGPYIRLEEGRYSLSIRYVSPADPKTSIGLWDVCAGARKIVARGQLPGTNGGPAIETNEFTLSQEDSQLLIETRVHFSGNDELRLLELVIQNLNAVAEFP
jgi:hypothetical protein